MASITLKNIPKFLHLEIKKRAEVHRRSINSEILTCLERFLGFKESEPEDIFEQAERIRKGVKGFLTQEMLDQYKKEGRR